MKPGRELDALVAEKVMGEPKPLHGLRFWGPSLLGAWEAYNGIWYARPYSTHITAAWTVDKPGWLWKFHESPQVLTVTLYTSFEMLRESVENYPRIPEETILIRREWLDVNDKARTYVWLRCLAALEAVGAEVGDA